jgi:hypothetical protein
MRNKVKIYLEKLNSHKKKIRFDQNEVLDMLNINL